MSGEWEISGTPRPSDYLLKQKERARQQMLALLEKQQTDYRAGDKTALALAIRICGQLGVPLMPWIVNAWAGACNDVASRKVGSWDAVLGNDRPTPKGLRRERAERAQLAMLVDLLPYLQNVSIKRDDEGDFFAIIASHLRISSRNARELYYKKLPKSERRLPKRQKR